MTIPLQRLPDWLPRLAELANKHRLTPYRYGTHDCWTFARAAVEAVTGTLLLPELESYSGWLGAAKLMIARGLASVEEVMTEQIGKPVDVGQSRAGDIISYENGGERHLAVRIGDGALAPAPDGMTIVAPVVWRHAWLVGEAD